MFSIGVGAAALPHTDTPATPTPAPAVVATQAPTQAPTQASTQVPTPTRAIPTPTPKPTQAPSLESQANTAVGGAGLTGHVRSVTEDSGKIEVNDDIGDGNLTNDLTKNEIENDCFEAQQALWTKLGSRLNEVTVNVFMNVTDSYGNTSNQQVGTCDLTKDTEQQFNWSNLTFDQAWQDYDNKQLAAFLTS